MTYRDKHIVYHKDGRMAFRADPHVHTVAHHPEPGLICVDTKGNGACRSSYSLTWWRMTDLVTPCQPP